MVTVGYDEKLQYFMVRILPNICRNLTVTLFQKSFITYITVKPLVAVVNKNNKVFNIFRS